MDGIENEHLEMVVPSLDDFTDGSRSHRWFVLGLQGKGGRDLAALFKNSDTEQERVCQAKNTEGHLLGGEGANAVAFELMSDDT